MKITQGRDSPLGLDIQNDEANFAIFSSHAERVILGLFDEDGALLKEIPLTKSGNVWHTAIQPYPKEGRYAFRVCGPMGPGFCFKENDWLADPYARAIASPPMWAQTPENLRSVQAYITPRTRPFDWQGSVSPNTPKSNLVIYEMHVRGFTRHPSSGASSPGTFDAIIEKIDYLKSLGVNAIELMPIFEFDETHMQNHNLRNYWGYSPLHFFSPMRRFAKSGSDPFGPIDEFKRFVREMHKNQIEVYLDAVYNHTGEGKELDYTIHFRGIDHPAYYILDEKGHLRDYTGCGNCLNANHPAVKELILDSLRYWIEEFQIDGFRFDLAAMMTRGLDGAPIPHPPILQSIASDPIISQVKLIAEPWDAAGLYLAGYFAQSGRWSEWNGAYRDHVRRFIKGTDGEVGKFANSLCGSDFIYKASKTPSSSVNFITAHDGFTLRDLVSYDHKHNEANGEHNKDGSDSNNSWNCGAEGVTDHSEISDLRERQMRNFFLALLLSQGIPMLSMRDEYGHSCQGNNNPYNQDNELNWFVWNERQDIVNFVSKLIAFRKARKELMHPRFLTQDDIQWHGADPKHADFGFHSRFIAFTLLGASPIYAAFNANSKSIEIELPKGNWKEWVATEKQWSEQSFEKSSPLPAKLILPPFSSLLAVSF